MTNNSPYETCPHTQEAILVMENDSQCMEEIEEEYLKKWLNPWRIRKHVRDYCKKMSPSFNLQKVNIDYLFTYFFNDQAAQTGSNIRFKYIDIFTEDIELLKIPDPKPPKPFETKAIIGGDLYFYDHITTTTKQVQNMSNVNYNGYKLVPTYNGRPLDEVDDNDIFDYIRDLKKLIKALDDVKETKAAKNQIKKAEENIAYLINYIDERTEK